MSKRLLPLVSLMLVLAALLAACAPAVPAASSGAPNAAQANATMAHALDFDDVHEAVIEHDGVTQNSVVTYEKFRKAWTRAGSWMLMVAPQAGDSHP